MAEFPTVFCLVIHMDQPLPSSIDDAITVSSILAEKFCVIPNSYRIMYGTTKKVFKTIEEARSLVNLPIEHFSSTFKSRQRGGDWIAEYRSHPNNYIPLIKISKEYKSLGGFSNKDHKDIIKKLLDINLRPISSVGFFMNNHNDAHLYASGIGFPDISLDERKTLKSLKSREDLLNGIWDAFWTFMIRKELLSGLQHKELIELLKEMSADFLEDPYAVFITLPTGYFEAAMHKEALVPQKNIIRQWLRDQGLLVLKDNPRLF